MAWDSGRLGPKLPGNGSALKLKKNLPFLLGLMLEERLGGRGSHEKLRSIKGK